MTARRPSVGAVAARCRRSVEAVSCTVEVSTRRAACVRQGPRAPMIAPSSPNGSGAAGSSTEGAAMRLRKRMGLSSARAAAAAAPPPPGRAKASAWRQSPATRSRLAGVGILASFKKLCNSSIELDVSANTWAALSSVRTRDQQASVSLTVRALTALAAVRSAAMREILQRGRKALTAWKVRSWTRAAPPGPAGAGCQSRHGVEETTSELAVRKIGEPEVGAPAGESTTTGCGAMAAIAPRRSRGGERKKRKPPLTREKENPCSRSHARNSERGAEAQRALRSVSE